MAFGYTEERIKEYLLPDAVTAKSDNVTGEDVLRTRLRKQNVSGRKDGCLLRGRGFVVLDFGREYYGGVRIITGTNDYGDTKPCFRIRFGESLSECYSDIGKKNASNDHATRDMCVYMSSNSDMEWGSTGYRYIRIDVIADGEFCLNGVMGTFLHGAEPVGSFKSDNPRLDAIFSAATRTLYLNAQNYIWDGIKRDRHVWVGDLFPEVLGILYLYGDCDVLRNTLDFIVSSYPLPCWYNDIPAYSIWFLLIVKEYYLHTGDSERRYTQTANGILRQLDACVDGSGDVEFDRAHLPTWAKNFFDWPSFGSKDENAACAALLRYALQEIASCGMFPSETVAVARGIAEKLKRRGEFRPQSKAMAAIGLLSGSSKAEWAIPFLKEGGAKGYSAFLSYFISRALADNGCTEDAYRNNLQFYGGMLDKGATTFWEGFDVDWIEGSGRIDALSRPGEKDIHGDYGNDCYTGFRHSLCHGWSCGVIGFIVEYIAGVRFYGNARMSVKPSPCGLNKFTLRLPTAYGIAEVRYENGKTSVSAPKGMTVCEEEKR